MSGLNQGLELIVRTAFGLATLIVMLRFLLGWLRADFHNPVSQFVVTVTQPAMRPLRRVVPAIGGVDMSALVLLFAVTLVEALLLSGLSGIRGNVIVWALGDMLRLGINVFFFAVLIGVVLSWLGPRGYNPVLSVIESLSDPLLGWARRLIPPIGGFDLSPIPVLLGLRLVQLWFVQPVLQVSGLPF